MPFFWSPLKFPGLCLFVAGEKLTFMVLWFRNWRACWPLKHRVWVWIHQGQVSTGLTWLHDPHPLADGRPKVCWELVSRRSGSLWSTLAFENVLVSQLSYLARNLFDFRFNSLPRGVTASGNGVELKSAWSPRSWITFFFFVSETDTEGPCVWSPNQWLVNFYPSHENKETYHQNVSFDETWLLPWVR